MIFNYIDKERAVLNEDGDVKTIVLKVAGKSFRCRCGANCFHHPDKENLDLYTCNSCGTSYEAKDK